MKFTPVDKANIPAITRGRGVDSDTAKLVTEFLAAGVEAAQVDETGDAKQTNSKLTVISSYCRRNKLNVTASLRKGKLYLFIDNDAPARYADQLEQAKARADAKALEAANSADTEVATEPDTDAMLHDEAGEEGWADDNETAEMPA